jgi:hypothetical protein
MIIFTSVAVFAMITFYSLSFLKNYLDSGTRHAIVIEHPNPVPGNEGSFPDADDVPPPPGALSSPNQNQSSNNLGQGKTPMPLSNKKTTPVKTKVFKAPEFKFLPSLKTYIPKNLQKSEKTIPEPAQKNISIKKNTTAPPVTSRIPAPLKKKAKAPVKSSSDRQHKNNIKFQQNSDMAILGAELKDAMQQNDTARVDKLLEKLNRTRGSESIYYLKIKAFKKIREHDYNAAKKLLDKVLAQDSTDFEANINMAVIDIMEQKNQNARKRLLKLKTLYPSRTAIDDLLNRL